MTSGFEKTPDGWLITPPWISATSIPDRGVRSPPQAEEVIPKAADRCDIFHTRSRDQ
jgi:hypothetical protein